MDWRKRPWNIQFLTDVLDNKLPIDCTTIIPVGGRGKKIEIEKGFLVFPDMSPNKVLTHGRGRRLKESLKVSQVGLKMPRSEVKGFMDLSREIEEQLRLDKSEDVDKSEDDVCLTSSSVSASSSSHIFL